MKTFVLCLALFTGQTILSLQEPQVVHLRPNQASIPSSFTGKLLELIDAPQKVDLPRAPVMGNGNNQPWSIDVKNLGPHAVMIAGGRSFQTRVNVGQTVHIVSAGSTYALH